MDTRGVKMFGGSNGSFEEEHPCFADVAHGVGGLVCEIIG